MDILAYGERNLARNLEENYKKLVGELCPIRREREKFEKFLKKWFKQVKSVFLKKLDSRLSIDRKSILIDRNKQRLCIKF